MDKNILYIISIILFVLLLYFQNIQIILCSIGFILLITANLLYKNPSIEFFNDDNLNDDNLDVNNNALQQISIVKSSDPKVNNLYVTQTSTFNNLHTKNMSTATTITDNLKVYNNITANNIIAQTGKLNYITSNTLNADTLTTNQLNTTKSAKINGTLYGTNRISSKTGELAIDTNMYYYPTSGNGANKWWQLKGVPTPVKTFSAPYYLN